MNQAITIQSLDKSYGKTPALRNVTLSIPEGKITALLGPNGAGKTTLLKAILGLTSITRGEILIHGQSWKHHESRRELAFLPERFNFFPFYTVEGVLYFYSEMMGTARSEERMITSLRRLDLADLAKRKIHTLSKGQLQRVGLAALLMGDARLFLLDEPFSGLDPIGMKELKDFLRILKQEGKTVLVNSHILSEVEQFSDHVAILHEGVLRAEGPLDRITERESLENVFYRLVKGGAQ